MGYNEIIIGDCFEVCKALDKQFDLVFLDPDYNDISSIKCAIAISKAKLLKPGGALLCFMYPEDIPQDYYKPDQVCHWIKPLNSRNTKKRYSRFVEAICIWHGKFFNQELNAATRTGIFTDTLTYKHVHPYRKPYSLVEKLLLLHCPTCGWVLDMFGGSFVVNDVCRSLNFNSISIDKIDWRLETNYSLEEMKANAEEKEKENTETE